MNRLAHLDALRGVAAALVVGSHTAGALSPAAHDFALHRFNLGTVGVAAFFLISGYIIPVSLQHGQRRFWQRRVWRLWPLYLVTLALTPLLDPAAPRDASTLLWNATMLGGWFGVPWVSYGFWTLSVELLFYVAASVVALTGWQQRPHVVAVCWTLGALALHLFPATQGTFAHLALWVSLMWCGATVAAWHAGAVSRPVALAVFVVVVGVLTFAPLAGLVGAHGGETLSRLVGVALFVVLLRRRPLPGAVWLGKVSYSLYLLHPFVYLIHPPAAPWWLLAGGWTVGALALAAAGERWIERPGMALGRVRLSRLRLIPLWR